MPVTLFDILNQLDELALAWENEPYSGDLSSAAKSVCARQLRAIIGDNPASFAHEISSCELDSSKKEPVVTWRFEDAARTSVAFDSYKDNDKNGSDGDSDSAPVIYDEEFYRNTDPDLPF